jgi:endonuclease III
MAAQRVAKLRACAATLAVTGDPRELVALPPPKACAALKQFPGIGDQGADRILLFAGAAAPIALESNGLRALLRLGYGRKARSYAASYRAAQQAADAELPATRAPRVDLWRRMRRHGLATCRATPLCDACRLAGGCPARQSVTAARATKPARRRPGRP